MTIPREKQRRVRIAFLSLLVVCVAQAAFWTVDQAVYTGRMHDQLLLEREADVRAALELGRLGVPRDRIRALYPEVAYAGDEPTLAPEARRQLDDESRGRLIRYLSEGAFFLAVLCGTIWLLARALREDAALRVRQQAFLAGASHEFKSPLASARLSLETLALRELPPEARGRLFDRALDDLARLDGLVANLLENAQLEEGGVRLVRERVDLGQAAQTALTEVESRARARAARLELTSAPCVACAADPVAVHSILRNLLDNALKAVAPEGGGRIDVGVEARGTTAVLWVADNGVGFPGEAAERLFQKFHREPGADDRARGGAGLGLYLVRRFAELQGGWARASSAGPGRGARFEVGWPLAASGAPAPAGALS
jgi:signal transduction histidine kinase